MAKYINKKIHVSIYLAIISSGVILIATSLLNKGDYPDIVKNIYSILSNLGTGLLTSGLIVWLLDTLNIGINDEIIAYKRYNLLKTMNVSIQNFLNDSANRYFDINSSILNNHIEPRYIVVKDIFSKVCGFDVNILKKYGNRLDMNNKVFDTIDKIYSKQHNIGDFISITNNILSEKDLYIINGIFIEDEIEIFERLNINASKYCQLVSSKEYIESTSYLDVIYDNVNELIATIPQFNKISHMAFKDYTIDHIKPVKIEDISDVRISP